jgi:four helix bundle protein
MSPEPHREAIRSYRDLIVWQRAMALAEEVYRVTRAFPKEEIYGLTSQMRRAAVSIPSNIAEGQGRQGRGELLQFLSVARGSLAELGTQLTRATRLGFVPAESDQTLNNLLAEVGRLLNALRNTLRRPPHSHDDKPKTSSSPTTNH